MSQDLKGEEEAIEEAARIEVDSVAIKAEVEETEIGTEKMAVISTTAGEEEVEASTIAEASILVEEETVIELKSTPTSLLIQMILISIKNLLSRRRKTHSLMVTEVVAEAVVATEEEEEEVAEEAEISNRMTKRMLRPLVYQAHKTSHSIMSNEVGAKITITGVVITTTEVEVVEVVAATTKKISSIQQVRNLSMRMVTKTSSTRKRRTMRLVREPRIDLLVLTSLTKNKMMIQAIPAKVKRLHEIKFL